VHASGADLRMDGGTVVGGDGVGIRVTGGLATLHDVAVSGMSAHGVLLESTATGHLDLLSVHDVAGAGIEYRGASGSVTRTRVQSVAESPETHTGSCIAVLETETAVRVASNRLEACALRGVRVYAGHALVEDNDVSGAGLVGISVTNGADAEVIGNRVQASRGAALTAGTGISVDRSTALVQGNRIAGSGLYGLRAEHADLRAIGNRISDCGQRGVSILGGATVLSGNRVADQPDFGIFLDSPEEASRIEDNEVVRATGAGLWLSVSTFSLVVARNRIRETRRPPDGGALAGTGDGIVLFRLAKLAEVHDNLLEDNAGAGLVLLEAPAAVSGNQAVGNGGGGILVSSTPSGVALTGNRLADNTGAGIHVFEANVSLSENTVDGTHADPATGQGEGLVLMSGATGTLANNTVRDSERNGLFLAVGASAVLTGNRITSSGRFGVECLGGYVEMGDGNVLQDNAAGAMSGCVPPPG